MVISMVISVITDNHLLHVVVALDNQEEDVSNQQAGWEVEASRVGNLRVLPAEGKGQHSQSEENQPQHGGEDVE